MNVTSAAIQWWKSKRPAHWDLHTHLENPEVNCSTTAEHDLARAVAEFEQDRIDAAIEAVEEARKL